MITVTLTACMQEPKRVGLDPVLDLVSNQQLVDMITIQLEIDGNLVVVIVSNHTDTDFAISPPFLEFYDVDMWGRIPGQEIELREILVLANDAHTFEVPLSWFERPERGLFRYRVRIYNREDLTTAIYDIVAEFELK